MGVAEKALSETGATLQPQDVASASHKSPTDDREDGALSQPERRESESATAAIIGGIIAAIIIPTLIGVGIFMYHKHLQMHENGEGPPKHKPPPPVKTGSSTEMLNKPQDQTTTIAETQPLSNVYYETRGEPVTDLDACDDDHPGNSANGGTPSGWENPTRPEEPDDSANEVLPPYSEIEEPRADVAANHEPPAANVARGESFISSPMLV